VQISLIGEGSPPTPTSSNPSSVPDKRSNPQTSSKPKEAHQGFVLLCVPVGRRLAHTQIETANCIDDDSFFKVFRKEYRRLRGLWRHWLHPRQFSYCHFSKFTRYYVDRLARIGNELPENPEYSFVPAPPDKPYEPPVPADEWYDRFYHLVNTRGLVEVLPRLPKRKRRFQVNLHVSGREEMWGLHVEWRISMIMVLLWQIIITAGGWVFFVWWLRQHPGDWSNAAIPMTLTLGAMMLLWLPLSEKMKEP
jgi:hypothetical protein